MAPPRRPSPSRRDGAQAQPRRSGNDSFVPPRSVSASDAARRLRYFGVFGRFPRPGASDRPGLDLRCALGGGFPDDEADAPALVLELWVVSPAAFLALGLAGRQEDGDVDLEAQVKPGSCLAAHSAVFASEQEPTRIGGGGGRDATQR